MKNRERKNYRWGYMVRSRRWIGIGLMVSLGVCGAQEAGRWKAASKTAQSITGDVELGRAKITFNFLGFPIAQIRALDVKEMAATFNAEDGNGAMGSLYRLSIPGAQKFVRKNTLCGNEDVQWMVTMASGRELQIAFFSGSKMPILTAEAVANTTDLCGTYGYTR